MSFVATDALTKILKTKVTTQFVRRDSDGDVAQTFTTAEWNKRKTVPSFVVRLNKRVDIDDMYIDDMYIHDDLPNGICYDDSLIPVSDAKRINIVHVGGEFLFLEDAKRFKEEIGMTVDLREELGYSEVRFSKEGFAIGCQNRTWEGWKREGEEVVSDYFRWNSNRKEVMTLLNLVLENKDKIIAKFGGTKKKAVKKVAAKKTTKKTSAKKTAKRK